MSYADTVALKAFIETLPTFQQATFVGEATKPAPNSVDVVSTPYVVLFPADGTNTTDSLTGPHLVENPEYTGWIVGDSAEQAGIGLSLIRQLLFPGGRGARITVAGRQNDRCWFESPVPLQRDASVTPPLHYHVFRTGWRSQPAPA
jgi:hypothetical protein